MRNTVICIALCAALAPVAAAETKTYNLSGFSEISASSSSDVVLKQGPSNRRAIVSSWAASRGRAAGSTARTTPLR
jgi:hypothetical protein